MLGNSGLDILSRRQAHVGRAGQSMIETALLLVGVVIALLAFFSFIRASVAFRIKTGADTFGHGMLYQPAPCNGAPDCREGPL